MSGQDIEGGSMDMRVVGRVDHNGEPYTIFEALQDGEPTGQTWEMQGIVSVEEMVGRLNDAEALLAAVSPFYRQAREKAGRKTRRILGIEEPDE